MQLRQILRPGITICLNFAASSIICVWTYKKPKCDDKIIMQLGNRLWSINTEIVLEVYKKIVEK